MQAIVQGDLGFRVCVCVYWLLGSPASNLKNPMRFFQHGMNFPWSILTVH